MKQANNNEMDLLLRSLARRESDRSFLADSLSEDHEHSAHLDADELSAYAERTLPAATRARYTTHLADCAQCRKIVAKLAPVVAASARELADEREASTAWQTIRQFFSWPVLRYAVPALSILAFFVVGLVFYRVSREGLVARAPQPEIRQDQPAQTSPAAEPQKGEISEPQKSETSDDLNYGLPADQQAKTKIPAETSASRTDATSAAEGPTANLSKDADAAKPTPSAAQPTYAPEPASPAPKPQEQVAEVRREAAAQTEAAARPQSTQTQDRRASDRVETYGERAKEEERARAKAENKQAQVGTVASQTAPDQNRSAKLRSLGAGRGEGAGKKDDEAAEIRTVAGRRFRRQEGMWVDTAYKSGMSLTHVPRGSEQYRALIADEPSIRNVAEQLPGEVILIWKGRGYRIR